MRKMYNSNCCICNIPLEVSANTYHKSCGRNNGKPKLYCRECKKQMLIEYNKSRSVEEKNKIYSKIKETWENKSDEEKRIIGKRISGMRKEWWDNLTQEEKDQHVKALIERTKSSEIRKKISDSKKEFYKNNPEAAENIGKKNREIWNNKSQDEKDLISKKKREWYDKLTDEEKEAHRQKSIDYFNNLSDEEYASIGQRVKDWWNGLSDEEKEKIRKREKDRWDNLPEEEKEKISIREKERYQNLEDYEKGKIKERLTNVSREYWDNINKDQYRKKLLESAEKSNKISNYNNLQNTEVSFTDILKLNNINFSIRYFNTLIHEDFDKFFPYNKVTGSKLVSPYHQWDFLIKTKQKNILVDIDGSIHDPDSMNFKVPGQSYTVRELIDFNDRQRPYQTDGLDAYVIKCYKDDLYDKDVIVESVNDGVKYTLIDFIKLINSNNIDIRKIVEECM